MGGRAVTVLGCSFKDDYAQRGGGSIYSKNGPIRVSHSRFSNSLVDPNTNKNPRWGGEGLNTFENRSCLFAAAASAAALSRPFGVLLRRGAPNQSAYLEV